MQRDLKSSFAWSAAESVMNVLAAVATTILVGRIIGPAAFGLAALAWLFGSLAEVLVTTPLVDPLIQRRRLDPPVVDTAFTVMLATGVLLYLLILAAAPLLAWLYAEPELTGLLAVQGTTCLLTAVRGVPEALLARELRFRALAIRGIIAKVAGALVAIGAASLHAGAWSVILGNVAFAAAATATIASIAPRWPRLAWLPQHARSLWSFGVFSVLDAFLWMATIRLFSVLAGYFHGTRALGELNFALRINDTLCAFMLAVTTRLALPIFSRVAQDPRQLEKVFLEGTRVAFLLVAPAFLGLAFVSREIISLALGPDWPFAAPSLVAACLFSLLNFSCVLGHSTVKAAGKPSLLIFPNLVGLAYILVGTVAVGHFRFEALLAVWTSWGVVFVVCSLRMVRKAIGTAWQKQLQPLAPSVVPSLLMCAVLYAITLVHPAALVVTLLLKLALGGLTYLLAVAVLEKPLAMQIIRGTAQTGR